MADKRKVKKIVCNLSLPIPDDRKKTRIIEDYGGLWRVQSYARMPKGKNGWRDEFRMDNYPSEDPSEVVVNLSAVLQAAYERGKQDGEW